MAINARTHCAAPFCTTTTIASSTFGVNPQRNKPRVSTVISSIKFFAILHHWPFATFAHYREFMADNVRLKLKFPP